MSAAISAGRTVLPAVAGGPGALLEASVRVAADRMRGERVEPRPGVSMTVVDMSCAGSTLGIARGQVDAVRFQAADVRWPGVPLAELTVSARDLRLAGPLTGTVTAAEVRFTAEITEAALRDYLAVARPGLDVRLDGAVSVSRVGWPAALRVDPAVDEDGGVSLSPVSFRIAGLGGALSSRLRPIRLPIPELPRGLRLTSIAVVGNRLLVSGSADTWRDRLSGRPLGELLALLAALVR